MKKAAKYAFIQTIPVMLGYLFLGLAFGILLDQEAGLGALWAAVISITVYAGSCEFVLVSLLASGASLPTIALTTLFLNSRHMFYGLSFIEQFRKTDKFYPYMIFSLTDETYSVFTQIKTSGGIPQSIDSKHAQFFIALFDQCYWVLGSFLGGLVGSLVPIDWTGIDFSMTALFVVIFVEQWQSCKSHFPAIAGAVSAIVFLLILEPDSFLLPAICVAVIALCFVQFSGRFDRFIKGGEES